MNQKIFWENNAEEWAKVIRSNSIASRPTTNTAIVEEILTSNAKSVLDLGCGEGWLVAALAKHKVEGYGLDASAALIEIAKKNHGPNFAVVSYEDLIQKKWSPPKKFDVAVFNFSLLEENTADLLKAVHLLLHSRGKILIQTLHPCFSLPEYEDRWNEETFQSMGGAFKGTMPWFGRTLESWFEVFSRCNFRVEALREPKLGHKVVSLIFVLSA